MNDPYFTAEPPVSKPNSGGRPKWRWTRYVLTYLAAALFGWVVALYPFVTSENFGKPLGRDIPIERPDEARRIQNPEGFSMVFPPAWEVYSSQDSELAIISGYPRSLIPRRHGVMLMAFRSCREEPFDLANLRPATFQERPAYESGRCILRTRPDSPTRWPSEETDAGTNQGISATRIRTRFRR